MIVLPDGAVDDRGDDTSTGPPSPRQPDDGEVDAEVPPRPTRRR